MNSEELIDALYSEMAEFGFLTKYIYGKGIEEIDINSWKDIEIQYLMADARNWRSTLIHLNMPLNVIRRMPIYQAWYLIMPVPAVLGIYPKIFVLQY